MAQQNTKETVGMNDGASQATTLKEDAGGVDQNFSATGKPMPKYDPSALGNLPGGGGFVGQAPQNLPWKFHDDDYITVPVPVEDDGGGQQHHPDDGGEKGQKKKNWASKLGAKITGKDTEKKAKFQMVRMTKADYLKYYAKDEHGNYAGSEPEGSRPPIKA